MRVRQEIFHGCEDYILSSVRAIANVRLISHLTKNISCNGTRNQNHKIKRFSPQSTQRRSKSLCFGFLCFSSVLSVCSVVQDFPAWFRLCWIRAFTLINGNKLYSR
jgi:hypothetical protein